MPGRKDHEDDAQRNYKNANARYHTSMAKYRERHPEAACVKEYDSAVGNRSETKLLLEKWRAAQESWAEVTAITNSNTNNKSTTTTRATTKNNAGLRFSHQRTRDSPHKNGPGAAHDAATH